MAKKRSYIKKKNHNVQGIPNDNGFICGVSVALQLKVDKEVKDSNPCPQFATDHLHFKSCPLYTESHSSKQFNDESNNL